jgi:hypothetical protein
VVTATFGQLQHRDRFDPDDAFKRAKFRDSVISKFQWDDSAHEPLESKILAAAESSCPLSECRTVRLSDVTPEEIDWLWRERIAIGKLTLLVGDPGEGKSFLTLDIASRVSRGAAWPDAPKKQQPAGDVILLSAEDGLGDTVRPRLDAHNADVGRIIAISGTKFFDEADDQERQVNLATDLDSIRRVVESANDPRAIIIDPVSAYLGKTDSHKNAEVRGVLAPLSALASELRVAVIAVSHLRKGEGAALYRTMGSLAFIAAARSAWVVCRDTADPKRRLMLPLKSNIAPDVGGLAFAILPHGPGNAPVLCWEGGPVLDAADDVIGHKRKPGPAPDERTEVAQWLRAELIGGPRHAKELIDDGDGFGYSKRTIQRAYREVIKGKPSREGFGGPVIWSLPIGDTTHANGTGHTQHGTNGHTWHQCTNTEEEENIKFLSNESVLMPDCGSVAPPDDVAEREAIIAESNGSDFEDDWS